MARHNDIGKWGENLAREFYITQGYAIMDNNTHIGHKEIDIIATKGNQIIFCGVKTRSHPITDPTEVITEKKIKQIVRAADSFIESRDIKQEARFDIIFIVGTPETKHTLEHLPDAFIPPLNNK